MGVGLGAPQGMNEQNSITKETKLYGLIAQEAMQERLFALVNKLIKPEAMMIPMNIREDDFYFTLANMKKSQLSGAYIAREYQESVLDLLDEKDETVAVYGRCDFVVREGTKLKGYFVEKNDVSDLETLAEILYENFIKGSR
jgi:shikimate 5-dehydrogenase